MINIIGTCKTLEPKVEEKSQGNFLIARGVKKRQYSLLVIAGDMRAVYKSANIQRDMPSMAIDDFKDVAIAVATTEGRQDSYLFVSPRKVAVDKDWT